MSDGVLVYVYQPALQGNKALICSDCQLWYKYSHLGLFQTVTSQNQSREEIGKIDCGEPATAYYCNMFTHQKTLCSNVHIGFLLKKKFVYLFDCARS